MSSTQVIDVKVTPKDTKKPRAPKKEKTPSASESVSDTIPTPTDPTSSDSVSNETKTKKPRATKKDKASTDATSETPVETASTTDVALDVESDAKQKKPRTPTLPAKFAKFIKFNFFFINQMTDIDQDTKDAYLKTFAVFAPVDQQTQIVTDFLLTQKSVNKDYRSALSAQKKAIAKANKPQRRSKKSVQVDFQNNLVNQLIESANNNDSNNPSEPKEKKPRGRKPKQTDSTPNESCDSAPKDAKSSDSAKDAKEKKPRGRKPKQTEAAQPASDATNASNEADQDEDTEVSRFVHSGKTFLRDRENNLYDELSHEPVGEYDPATDSIVLL